MRCGASLVESNPQAPHASIGAGASSAGQTSATSAAWSASETTQATHRGRPSYTPTIVITVLFGLFGLFPAFRHSRMARERGHSTSGYWVAFWLCLVLSFVVFGLVIAPIVRTSSSRPQTVVSAPGGGVSAPSAGSPSVTVPASGWSSGDSVIEGGGDALSCASMSLCVAGGGDDAYVYSNGTWSGPDTLGISGGNVGALSCVPDDWCMALVNLSDAVDTYTYSNGEWSGPDPGPTTPDGSPISAVSCASASFCMAVDGFQDAFAYNDGSWGALQEIASGGPSALTCLSANFCAGVGDSGASIYTGVWRSSGAIIPSLSSISCPTTSWCVALGNNGYFFTYSNGLWVNPSDIGGLAGTNSEVSVSCPTTSWCMASDAFGATYQYSDGSWEGAGQIDVNEPDTNVPPVELSCPGVSFCVALSPDGEVFTYR